MGLFVCCRNGSVGWLPNNLNQGHLDYYYVVLVIMSVLNIFFFIIVAKLYKYKKVRRLPDRLEYLHARKHCKQHGTMQVCCWAA